MTRHGLPRNLSTLASLARRYDQEAHAPLLNVTRSSGLLLAPLRLAPHASTPHRFEHRAPDVLVDH